MKKRIRKFTAIVSAVALALTGGNIGGIGMLTARAEAQDAFVELPANIEINDFY